jgi:hypothetical protein
MTAAWRDIERGSIGTKEVEITSAEVRIDGFALILVHRHIHYSPDQWLLTCHPFFDKFELDSKPLNLAKKEALKRVHIIVRDADTALKELRK